MPHIFSYKTKTTVKVSLAVLMLLCGCGIYLLFRSKSLNIYRWCASLGISDEIDFLRYAVNDWSLSEFIKFSLPDGLYCAAYILIMDSIWNKECGWIKYAVILFLPLFTIGSEILQFFGLVKGTFDIYDLLCYSIPPLVYIISNNKLLTFNKIKLKKL